LLNVILFPRTGCNRTGTARNPVWIAVLWRASFPLATGTPVQVHRTLGATNIAARTLDAQAGRFLYKDS
jgi:hypothetical protein